MLLTMKDVSKYVENNIGTFHQKRIASIDSLSLSKVLKRKNPYLFKAKHVLTAEEIIRGLVDAHISSNEETIFGDWLEGLAIFINEKVYQGWKSTTKGIDLEFDKEGKRYIVNIKSGPNWGNSSQVAKMISDFKTAARTLRTSNSGLQVIAVNGCCYGQNPNEDRGDYFKYCGQAFWEFISGNQNLYIEIIEPLGHMAKQQNDTFRASYAQLINRFTREFGNEYCDQNGVIDWIKLVQFNSSVSSLERKKR
jgi:hypothetical protein